jgi:hypothetical protein
MSDNTNLQMNVEEKTPTPSPNPSPITEQKPINPELKVEIPLLFLQNVRNIISVAGDRGAFKTGEMYAVGSIFNSLTQLLETNKEE